MSAVEGRARLEIGSRRLVKEPSDPSLWHERTITAAPGAETTAPAMRSGMVAVLTTDWDTYLMSQSTGPLSDGLVVGRNSGPIPEVAGTYGVAI